MVCHGPLRNQVAHTRQLHRRLKQLKIAEPVQTGESHAPTGEKPKAKHGGFRPGGGRPRKPEAKAPVNEPFIIPTIPRTKGSHFFADFVEWWHKLNEDQLNKLIIYVYRTWPLVDVKLVDPQAETNVEKMTGPCPFTVDGWQNEVMGKWGSGSYTFLIKEGPVQRWTVYANNLRDLNNFPPLIDHKALMLNDPANKDYVKWARTRNLIESDTPNNGEGNDMATNAAVDRLLDNNTRLTDRLIESFETNNTRGEAPDASTTAQLAGMEMIQRAGERALDIAMKSTDRLAEMSGRSQDPLELVKAFTAMSASMHGNGSKGDDAVMLLMKDMREQDREQMKLLREELADNRKLVFELLAKKNDDEEDKPKGILGMLSEMKQLKEYAGDVLGLNPSSPAETDAAEGVSKKGGGTSMLLDMAVRNAVPLMQGLQAISANLITAFMLARNPQGQQQQPQGQPGQPLQTGQQPQQQYQQPGLPATPPIGSTPLTPFLTQLTPTILHHMGTDGLNGGTLGNWLIESGPQPLWPQPGSTGRTIFDFLKESGKEAVVEVLKTHAPLWDVAGQTPKKLELFIDELLKADEEEQEEEGQTAA